MTDRRLEEEVDAVFRKKGKEESSQMGGENKSEFSPKRGGASRHRGLAKEVCERMVSHAVKRRAAKKRLGRDHVKEIARVISGVTLRRRERCGLSRQGELRVVERGREGGRRIGMDQNINESEDA